MTVLVAKLTTCPSCKRKGVGMYLVCDLCGRPVCGGCGVDVVRKRGKWQCSDGCTLTEVQTVALRAAIAAQLEPEAVFIGYVVPK